METAFAIRHFPDRKKPCSVLEQGNQAIVIATIRNTECEKLLREYFGGACGIWGDMRYLFEPQKSDNKGMSDELVDHYTKLAEHYEEKIKCGK